MCEICQRKNCPPRCPNYSSHSRKLSAVYGSCAKCGSIIHYGEVSFRKSGLLVCNDCHTTLYKKTDIN